MNESESSGEVVEAKSESSTEVAATPVVINLKKLKYAPHFNPLLEPQAIHTKRRYVRSGTKATKVDLDTGEITDVASIYSVEKRDDASFVKVFTAGVAAAYELGKTGARVFQAVLQEYENTPMHKGYADSVELAWFDEGLCGRKIGMSEKTFQRGLKELLAKGFLSPRTPNTFWVNPALFFRGDRVRFITEYQRKKAVSDESNKSDNPNSESDQDTTNKTSNE